MPGRERRRRDSPCHPLPCGLCRKAEGGGLKQESCHATTQKGQQKNLGATLGVCDFLKHEKIFYIQCVTGLLCIPPPPPNKHFKKCAEVRKALSSADFFFLSCPGCAAGRRRHKLRLQTRAVWSVLPIGVRVEVIGGAQARLRHPVSVPCPGGGRCDSLQTGRRRGRARPQRRMPNRWTPVQHASAGPGCSMSAPCDSKAPALDELSHEASMCRQDRMHTSCTARWRP